MNLSKRETFKKGILGFGHDDFICLKSFLFRIRIPTVVPDPGAKLMRNRIQADPNIRVQVIRRLLF